jgi:hypothetical protein
VLLSEGVVLVTIDIIEAFLGCAGSGVDTGLEDTVVMLSVSNWLELVATGTSFSWVVLRVHEEVATSLLLKG